jgi:hypothetical protein
MNGITSTYIVQLREYCAFDLKVSADSPAAAIEKAQAFYAKHRKPASRYEENGLRAELTATTVRCSRQAASPSAWAKARAATRDSQRDAAQAA